MSTYVGAENRDEVEQAKASQPRNDLQGGTVKTRLLLYLEEPSLALNVPQVAPTPRIVVYCWRNGPSLSSQNTCRRSIGPIIGC